MSLIHPNSEFASSISDTQKRQNEMHPHWHAFVQLLITNRHNVNFTAFWV